MTGFCYGRDLRDFESGSIVIYGLFVLFQREGAFRVLDRVLYHDIRSGGAISMECIGIQ
jgi:hypothetical protein